MHSVSPSAANPEDLRFPTHSIELYCPYGICGIKICFEDIYLVQSQMTERCKLVISYLILFVDLPFYYGITQFLAGLDIE
ncbi:hypothetical protein KY290_029580 [Solanum tuberosum]|uniref:Uncharacterized protein n=1 Tax=Solanum tuberosum TaxID=4113 RepID=A0ABQ7UL53_SOLTU|nr:hypothetical protein KY289_028772 [Solanum tuberosum]KAH0750348.1 hypothetical protein KY290_029580 [Solanum tuberosum]